MISRYLGIEKSQPVSKPCTNNAAVLLYIRYTAQRYKYVLYCVLQWNIGISALFKATNTHWLTDCRVVLWLLCAYEHSFVARLQ